MRGWLFRGQGEGSKVKALKTSGGGRTPVRHTIPLGIVIFLVLNISLVPSATYVTLDGWKKINYCYLFSCYCFVTVNIF